MLSRLRTLIFGSPDDRALDAALRRAEAVLDRVTERLEHSSEPVAFCGAIRNRNDGETSLSFLRADGRTLSLHLSDNDARSLHVALFDLHAKTRPRAVRSPGNVASLQERPPGPPPPKKT